MAGIASLKALKKQSNKMNYNSEEEYNEAMGQEQYHEMEFTQAAAYGEYMQQQEYIEFEMVRFPVSDAQGNEDINDLHQKKIIHTEPNESVEVVWNAHTETSF